MFFIIKYGSNDISGLKILGYKTNVQSETY